MDAETVAAVRSAYGGQADTAIRLLASYGTEPWHREPDRVRRAVLALAHGDLDRLQHFVSVARRDYRDVLYWAEYPPDQDEPRTYEELRDRLGLPPDA